MRSTVAACLTALSLIAASAFDATAQERVLRVNDSPVGELDPHKGSDYADSMLMFNVYDFLVRAAPGGEIVPDLALSWTVSEDGLTYTFDLRDDAVFHDGEPLEAEDVVFSANRLTTMKRGFSYLIADYASVEAQGPHKVVFQLNEPFAPFLASLTRLAIVNKDLVTANIQEGEFGEFGDYADQWLSANEAGSGAYIVESHDPQSLTVMRRNEGHYGGFAPSPPDIVRLSYGIEPATLRAMLPRDEHDVTRMQLPVEVLTALDADPDVGLVRDAGSSSVYIKLNMQRPPTDDVHFRRALALAFDYDAALSLLQVTEDMRSGVPANGPLPRGVMGFDESAPFPKRDLEAAKAELAKSRYGPNEHPMQIQWVAEVPSYGDLALIFQQSVSELGIDVEVVRSPWALLLDRATTAETTPHANTVAVSGNTPDPDSLLSSMYHSSNAGSWTSMDWVLDDEVDAMIEKGRTIQDPAEREEFYVNLVRHITDLQPSIFAYMNQTVVAKRTDVRVPTLDDPDQAIASMGMNYVFRNFTID